MAPIYFIFLLVLGLIRQFFKSPLVWLGLNGLDELYSHIWGLSGLAGRQGWLDSLTTWLLMPQKARLDFFTWWWNGKPQYAGTFWVFAFVFIVLSKADNVVGPSQCGGDNPRVWNETDQTGNLLCYTLWLVCCSSPSSSLTFPSSLSSSCCSSSSSLPSSSLFLLFLLPLRYDKTMNETNVFWFWSRTYSLGWTFSYVEFIYNLLTIISTFKVVNSVNLPLFFIP